MRNILFAILIIASPAVAAINFCDPIMVSDPWDVLDRVDPEMTVDGDAVYVIWSEFGNNEGVRVNYSSDGGYSWDTSESICSEWLSGELRGFADVVTGVDGYAYGFFAAGDTDDMNLWFNKTPPGQPNWESNESEIFGGGDDTRTVAAVSPTTGCIALVYWFDRYAIYCTYSDDGGDTWSTPGRIDEDSGITYGPSIAVDAEGRFYAAWSDDMGTDFDRCIRVSYSDDAVSWSSPATAANPDPGYATNVGIGAGGDGIVCCAFRDTRNGGDWDIYCNISDDGGQTWLTEPVMIYDEPSDLADRPSVTVSDSGEYYIAFEAYDGYEKVVFTADSDDGTNWDVARAYPSGTAYQGLPDIAVRDDGEVFVVWRSFEAYTSSIYIARSGPSGFDDDEPTAPIGYYLSEARPNPSSGTARISFNLPEACYVALEVFDVKGRKVKTLAEGHYSEGKHSANVNGLSSGVYLYQLSAGTFADTRKMVVK